MTSNEIKDLAYEFGYEYIATPDLEKYCQENDIECSLFCYQENV